MVVLGTHWIDRLIVNNSHRNETSHMQNFRFVVNYPFKWRLIFYWYIFNVFYERDQATFWLFTLNSTWLLLVCMFAPVSTSFWAHSWLFCIEEIGVWLYKWPCCDLRAHVGLMSRTEVEFGQLWRSLCNCNNTVFVLGTTDS